MASTPPKVKWMVLDTSDPENPHFADINPQHYWWDAGVVEAGSSSLDNGENEFYVWNNFNGTEDVADMINVRISVRDENGTDVDKKVCGSDSDGIAKQASVAYQMFNASAGTIGEWGSFDATGAWNSGTWQPLTAAVPVPITQTSGDTFVTQRGGTVKGTRGRSGQTLTDKKNYIHLKLQITAKGYADAGTVKWINRISYQYQ